jgi:hypothetical protein
MSIVSIFLELPSIPISVYRCFEQVEHLSADVTKLRHRVVTLEDEMPLKADKAELEAAIKEFKEEIEKLNIEESMQNDVVITTIDVATCIVVIHKLQDRFILHCVCFPFVGIYTEMVHII